MLEERHHRHLRRTRARTCRAVVFMVSASLLLSLPVTVGSVALRTSGAARATVTGGGWHAQASEPGPFYRVACPTVSECVAAGPGGYVARSVDGGLEWSVTQVLGLGSEALGVACPSPSECWVAGQVEGSIGALDETVNGGATWTAASVPSGIAYLDAISCASATSCVAVGGTGSAAAIVATQTGATWSAEAPPAGVVVLTGVSCASAVRCWAVGSTGSGGALITTSNGTSWSPESIPASTGLNSIACLPASTLCQAVGLAGGNALALGTLNGTSWASESTSTLQAGPVSLNDVSCPTAGDCIAVDKGGFVVTTTNGGGAWSVDANAPPGLAGYIGVGCTLTTSHCVLVGEQRSGVVTMEVSNDWTSSNGGSFSASTIGGDVSILGMTCPSVSFCVAVGDGSAGAVAETSTDSGGLWSETGISSAVEDLFGVSCPSTSVCFAVGDLLQGGAAVVKTVNGGATWSVLTVSSQLVKLFGISCPDTTHCFAVDTTGQVAATTDGTHWNVENTPESLTGQLIAISCVSDTSCWAAGIGPLPAQAGVVVATSNAGASWSEQLTTSPTSITLDAISCYQASTVSCFAGGTTTTAAFVVASANGGASWGSQALPSGAGLTGLNGITCVSTQVCDAVDASGTIVATQDAGAIWATVTGPFSVPGLAAVTCVTAVQCWAAGGGSFVSTVTAINSITPSSGPPAGGTQVTISGAGFTGATGVSFGSVPAASFAVVSPTVMTAVSPPGSPGRVDVTVTVPGAGTSARSVDDGFLYVAPGPTTAISPNRIVDTRPGATDPATYAGRTLGPGRSLTFAVAGVAGVPANASAVVLNVTAIGPTSWGYLIVYPAGVGPPGSSSVNFSAGESAVANFVEVPIGEGGADVVTNAFGVTNVAIDVEGYVAVGSGPAGKFHPITPVRLADTRKGATDPSTYAGRTLGPGGSLTVAVSGAAGLPSTGVAAVAVTLTGLDATAAGAYLTLYPAGATAPDSSTLNLSPGGAAVPNESVVGLGAGGAVTVRNALGSTDVLVDVVGWYSNASGPAGLSFQAVSPSRVADSRTYPGDGYQLTGHSLAPGTPVSVTVGGWRTDGIPTTASAVQMNLTVTDTAANGGYLVVWPAGATMPGTSNLNWYAGETVADGAASGLGAGSAVQLVAGNSACDVIVDVAGYYA